MQKVSLSAYTIKYLPVEVDKYKYLGQVSSSDSAMEGRDKQKIWQMLDSDSSHLSLSPTKTGALRSAFCATL